MAGFNLTPCWSWTRPARHDFEDRARKAAPDSSGSLRCRSLKQVRTDESLVANSKFFAGQREAEQIRTFVS